MNDINRKMIMEIYTGQYRLHSFKTIKKDKKTTKT